MELRFEAMLYSNLEQRKCCCGPYQMFTRAAGSPPLVYYITNVSRMIDQVMLF